MDPQTLSIITAVISTPVVMRLVESWIKGRTDNAALSTDRLTRLEAAVNLERANHEETKSKLFDLSVKHEVLVVHFDNVLKELRECKDENGILQKLSHQA